MPWISIIMFVISYFTSKATGMSDGKAALVGAAAGLGTYYLADPANADNVLGVTYGKDGAAAAQTAAAGVSKTVPGATTENAPNRGIISTVGGVATTAIQEASKTAQSWGPLGTLGVVTGTAALTSESSGWEKWLLPIGIVTAIVLLR